jgi:riboflavin kinase/FMN adenylyltransferase
MQRWRDLTEVARGTGPTVVTIGVFDGVHRGHQRVLGRAVAIAREQGARTVVVTFDPHPASVVRPDAVPPLLATVERRIELFERYGADAVVVVPFDKERSRESAEDFVRELVKHLRPLAIVVGDDFRFGHKAAGDLDLLRTMGAELGFEVEGLHREAPTPAGAGQSGERSGDQSGSGSQVPVNAVSSTAVRDRLGQGDVAGARDLLGHPFRFEGVVVEGAHRGRELGFPTANVPGAATMALPSDGVYAGWLRVHDLWGPGDAADPGDPEGSGVTVMPAAISVGTNPQFGHEPRRVESYVLDRDDLDLYGRRVEVEFVDRVRGQERFDSVEALITQMSADVERVRQILDADRPTT